MKDEHIKAIRKLVSYLTYSIPFNQWIPVTERPIGNIAKELNVPPTYVSMTINVMTSKGLMETMGSRAGLRYKIKEKIFDADKITGYIVDAIKDHQEKTKIRNKKQKLSKVYTEIKSAIPTLGTKWYLIHENKITQCYIQSMYYKSNTDSSILYDVLVHLTSTSNQKLHRIPKNKLFKTPTSLSQYLLTNVIPW